MATSNNWALSWFFPTFCSINVLAMFVRDVMWFTVVQRNLSTVLQAQGFPGWQFLWIFLHKCFVFPPSQLGVGLSPWQSFLGQFRYTIVFPCPVLHTSSEYTLTRLGSSSLPAIHTSDMLPLSTSAIVWCLLVHRGFSTLSVPFLFKASLHNPVDRGIQNYDHLPFLVV